MNKKIDNNNDHKCAGKSRGTGTGVGGAIEIKPSIPVGAGVGGAEPPNKVIKISD